MKEACNPAFPFSIAYAKGFYGQLHLTHNSSLLLRVYVLIGSELLEGGVALPLAQLEM